MNIFLDMMRERYGLSVTTLKWIAIIVMAAGHVIIIWSMMQPLGRLILSIGHVTPPIMCFFIAEGFHYTRNRMRYARRLLIFAIIGQIPFNFIKYGTIFHFSIGIASFNMIFSLLLGLCALWIIKSTLKPVYKIALILLCIPVSALCDWPIFSLLWVLIFGLNRGSLIRQTIWFSLSVAALMVSGYVRTGGFISIWMGTLLFLPLLMLYNGKKASDSTPAWIASKWVFYVFYPLHFLILGFLHYVLGV